MKTLLVLLVSLASVTALGGEGSLRCRPPEGHFLWLSIPKLETWWRLKAYAQDGYANAELACGRSETAIECSGFYFGWIGHPVRARVDLQTKTGWVDAFYDGRTPVRCELVESQH